MTRVNRTSSVRGSVIICRSQETANWTPLLLRLALVATRTRINESVRSLSWAWTLISRDLGSCVPKQTGARI